MTTYRVAIAVLIVLVTTSAGGQTAAVGIQPFGSYQSSQADTISMGDLGVHITIPLYTHKGRGRNAGVSVELRYASLSSHDDPIMGPGYSSGPWYLSVQTAMGGAVKITWLYGGDCSGMGDDGNYHDGGTFDVYGYSFVDETGYEHGFAGESRVISNCGSGWYPSSLSEFAADGSGYHLSGTGTQATVVDPAGTSYYSMAGYPTSSITDSNGNIGYAYAQATFGGNYPQTYTDNSNVSVSLSGGLYTFDGNGYPSSRGPGYVKYTDSNGTQQTITVNFLTFGTSGMRWFPIGSVAYPDGSSYQFTYQTSICGTGFLNSGYSPTLATMQLPTGGTISYHYTTYCQPYQYDLTLLRTTADGATTYSRTNESQSYGPARTKTTVSYPDGSSQTIRFVSPNYGFGYFNETYHDWRSSGGAILKTSMKCYNGATGDCTNTSIALPFTQMSTVFTLDSGQTSKTLEYFNANSSPTERDEYDYGASTPARKTITTYANGSASFGNYTSNRPQSVTIRDGSGTQIASTVYGYDETSVSGSSGLSGLTPVSGTRGNLTSKRVWVNTTGGTLDTWWTYDDAGRMLSAKDPRNNVTQYGYDSRSCQTSVTPPTPSNGISKATSATCDPYNVLPKTFTDANRTVTYYYFNAMLEKSEIVVKDSDGTKVSDTAYSYPSTTTMTTTVYTSATSSRQSTVVVDGFGRVSSKTGENGAVVLTTYNSMGRVKSVTNPYLSTNDATYGITSYLYDALGRPAYQCQPDDGGTNSSTCNHTSSYKSWTYYGNTTTFRDEAGKQWKNTNDALGRLTSVAEDPSSWNYITNYAYDPLNNLTRVDQWGASSNNSNSRVRTFAYDSLSRLLAANNPESGTTSYTYFSSGSTLCSGDPSLPCTKTNGNNFTSTYHYDELNRILQETSPSRNYAYAYDQAQISNCGGLSGTYPIGRLTYVSNNVNAAEFFVYNALGRLTRQTNWTPSNGSSTANPVCAVRDWSGNVTQLTYPDGRIVDQQFDSGGNLTGVAYGNYNYMSNATYWSDGAPYQMTYANGLTTTWNRNKRLQPRETVVVNGSSTQIMDIQYCYGASSVSGSSCTSQSVGDNGNIFQIRDMLNGNNTQTFGYDNLNRLVSFNNATNSMQQTYTIDPWGNSIQSGTLSSGTSFSGATNNRDTSGTTGYDNAGNVTTYNSYYNGTMTHHFAYDDDGEITNVDNGAATYTYDASGNRVRRDSGGAWTEYINFGGLTVAEKNNMGNWTDYIFANGQRIAKSELTQNVDVRFTNDSCSGCSGTPVGGGDRNLFINSVTVESTTIQSSDPGVSFVGVPCNGYSGSQAVLLCNGDWVDSNTPAGNSITISAYGSPDYNIYPHMQVYVNGKLAGEWDVTGQAQNYTVSTNYFYTADQIGSTHLVTDGFGNVTSSNQFYPYGQGAAPTSQNHYLFSGKERDSESGLDYFGARYYTSGIGRFMSADWSAQAQPVPYAKLEDPQTLNLYAYARNNPISIVDPDGHSGHPEMYNYWYPMIINPIACEWNQQIETRQNAQRDEAYRQSHLQSPQQVKAAAIRAGQVSGAKVGKVNIFAYGGTIEQRTAELVAIQAVLTGTDRGKQMLSVLEGRKDGFLGLWGNVKPFDLINGNFGVEGSHSYQNSTWIAIDWNQIGSHYVGGGSFSITRIVAHELGHAVMGADDDGPRNMKNVNGNENPIMRQLGDQDDRTQY